MEVFPHPSQFIAYASQLSPSPYAILFSSTHSHGVLVSPSSLKKRTGSLLTLTLRFPEEEREVRLNRRKFQHSTQSISSCLLCRSKKEHKAGSAPQMIPSTSRMQRCITAMPSLNCSGNNERRMGFLAAYDGLAWGSHLSFQE